MARYPLPSEIKLPLLITGIAGVSGYNAFRYYHNRYPGQVVGVRRNEYWPLTGEGIVGCDITDLPQLTALCQQYHFQTILSCLGNCRLKSCELDPAMATEINVQGIDHLLTALQSQQNPCPRLVHLSIDLVFSGTRPHGGYCETDTPDPVTVYGRTMVEGEQIIRQRMPEATIIRISLPMGPSFSGHAGAIDWIQSRFQKNKPATLYFDEIRTPQYTDCLNQLTHWLLTHDVPGTYHAGGPRQLSLYEIAQIVNRVGGYDPQCLIGCPRIDAGPIPPRAGNVTLDSTQLQRLLGFAPFDPWPWGDLYLPTDRQWHQLRDTTIIGSPELLDCVLYNNPNG